MGLAAATRDNIKHLEQALLDYRTVVNLSPARGPGDSFPVLGRRLWGPHCDFTCVQEMV